MTGFGLRGGDRHLQWAVSGRRRVVRWPSGRDGLLAAALLSRGALLAVVVVMALWGGSPEQRVIGESWETIAWRSSRVAAMLWLLRHGDAEDGSPDAERPLSAKGERQSRAAGQALASLGVQLDACLTSPKIRAAETARLACEPLGVEPRHEPRLAGGPFDAEQLAAGLDEVLLVGHDPDFSMAVHSMTGAQVRLKKGGIAGLDRGELLVLMRPSELGAVSGESK
jgi:phosphohistidine phosphatase